MNFQSMLSKLERKVASQPLTEASASTSNTIDDGRKHPPKKKLKTTQNTSGISQSQYVYPFPKRKVSIVYLACPPNVQTGGPEAMHQLCDKINKLSTSMNCNVTAYMLFLKEQKSNTSEHYSYESFAQHVPNARVLRTYESTYLNLKVATAFPMNVESEPTVNDIDSTYNDELIIWPECWTHLIDSFQPEENSMDNSRFQTAIWWLSVNNNNNKFRDWEREDLLHLHQSEYARCYLVDHISRKRKVQSKIMNNVNMDNAVIPMTEFIPSERHRSDKDGKETSSTKRDLQIIYNPFKGVHYTDSIIRRSGSKFTFTPIGSVEKRISPRDVTKLLQRSIVYVDFGPHPGMDRLPREAALAGCIVITNMEGAAHYKHDVPISDEYKVKEFDVDHIHRLLTKCIESYDDKRNDFDSYREWIGNQESKMDAYVETFLTKLTTNRLLQK